MSDPEQVPKVNDVSQNEDVLDPVTREREKELLVNETKRREENIKRDTEELFEQIQAYLRSELKSMLISLI